VKHLPEHALDNLEALRVLAPVRKKRHMRRAPALPRIEGGLKGAGKIAGGRAPKAMTRPP
jgi:hypothetical protein